MMNTLHGCADGYMHKDGYQKGGGSLIENEKGGQAGGMGQGTSGFIEEGTNLRLTIRYKRAKVCMTVVRVLLQGFTRKT